MNERAQVSIEYILIVGLLLAMVLIVYPYALRENELNKAFSSSEGRGNAGSCPDRHGIRTTRSDILESEQYD